MGIVAHDPVDKAQLAKMFTAGVGAATTTSAGTVKKAATQAAFAGVDVAALEVELNAFLTKLKNAGIVA